MSKDSSIFRILKFALIAIGHPIIFLLYLLLFSKDFFIGQVFAALGIEAFHQMATNISAINMPLFSLFALLSYALALSIQALLLAAIKRKLDIHKYIYSKLSIISCIISGIGMLNIFGWYAGMEGNAFGFLFFLPLLILCLLSFVIFFVQTLYVLFGNKCDKS